MVLTKIEILSTMSTDPPSERWELQPNTRQELHPNRTESKIHSMSSLCKLEHYSPHPTFAITQNKWCCPMQSSLHDLHTNAKSLPLMVRPPCALSIWQEIAKNGQWNNVPNNLLLWILSRVANCTPQITQNVARLEFLSAINSTVQATVWLWLIKRTILQDFSLKTLHGWNRTITNQV